MKKTFLMTGAAGLALALGGGVMSYSAAGPANSTIMARQAEQRGKEAQPGDDRGGKGKPFMFARETQPGDDRGRGAKPQPGDDHGRGGKGKPGLAA